ncbi:ABC transporter ATP-binding protein [Syntrophobotulus glycolicus]|uniref:ABC transporter ATP-binding protein n=1 Tax=Syntrophobotulus glycolicus TaxID=51197 RepID=UPI003D010A24
MKNLKNNILLNFVSENKITYLTGLTFMFLASSIQTLFPKILGNTIDLLKDEAYDRNRILWEIGLMLLISLFTFLFTYIWRMFIIGNARKFECTLREDLYKHFQTLSPEFYTKRKTGDLLAYAINDVLAVRMSLGPAAAQSINGIVICASSIYFMLTSVDFRLTLLTITPIPIVIFLIILIGKKIRLRFGTVQDLFGEISDRIQENIYGIRVVKAYVQEDQEIDKFQVLSSKMLDANIKMVKTSSLLTPIIEGCFSLSFVLSLVFGGHMVLSGQISVGNFVAFNTYLAMIMTPIVSIGRVINFFQRGVASLKRLEEIFRIPPSIFDSEAAIQGNIEGTIEFKNLTFSYPGMKKPALENLNLKIEKGKTIGVIGKTGSGKTTITNLLLKLYNVGPGQLYLDNIDINEYSLESIRNSISLVPQDTFLFSASIKDNIMSFKNIYSDDEIEAATKYSSIYENIANFPSGFDTILGERGVNLSGGQKQRVSIARAVIKNSSILILDDALSAVDSVTETHILNNFRTYRKEKTTLIISHRISAVSDCDEIVLLHNGKIYERGTHQELIEKGGLYDEIYAEQSEKHTEHCRECQ